ncbi:unnamed protein product [Arctogadus glacialis]
MFFLNAALCGGVNAPISPSVTGTRTSSLYCRSMEAFGGLFGRMRELCDPHEAQYLLWRALLHNTEHGDPASSGLADSEYQTRCFSLAPRAARGQCCTLNSLPGLS